MRLELMFRILQKVEEMNEFYENFSMQSYVPNGSIGKFLIGFQSSKIPPQFLYSKGGLKFVCV
uniref:Uncharacterized protein n=1 Tax=Arundo donax TaxID=35708 RepID=A0A0A9BDU7_ARUDO